jgi:hypothetical protein
VLLFSERLRSWRVRAWLGIAVAVSILWPYGGLVNLLATPLHQAWAATLVGGGALLGVATVFWDQGTKAE